MSDTRPSVYLSRFNGFVISDTRRPLHFLCLTMADSSDHVLPALFCKGRLIYVHSAHDFTLSSAIRATRGTSFSSHAKSLSIVSPRCFSFQDLALLWRTVCFVIIGATYYTFGPLIRRLSHLENINRNTHASPVVSELIFLRCCNTTNVVTRTWGYTGGNLPFVWQDLMKVTHQYASIVRQILKDKKVQL